MSFIYHLCNPLVRHNHLKQKDYLVFQACTPVLSYHLNTMA